MSAGKETAKVGDFGAERASVDRAPDDDGEPDDDDDDDLFEVLCGRTRVARIRPVEQSAVFAAARHRGHAAHERRPSKAIRPDDPAVSENDPDGELAAGRAHRTKVLRPPPLVFRFAPVIVVRLRHVTLRTVCVRVPDVNFIAFSSPNGYAESRTAADASF